VVVVVQYVEENRLNNYSHLVVEYLMRKDSGKVLMTTEDLVDKAMMSMEDLVDKVSFETVVETLN
jgi:hypothetical protein